MWTVARGVRAGAVRAYVLGIGVLVAVVCPAVAVAGMGAADNLSAQALRADDAITAGRFDEAMTGLSAALKLYPKDPNIDMIYGLACEAYLGKKHDMMAESYCSAAILRNDHMPRYVAARALANYRLGNRLAARRDTDAALALGGTKPWLYGLKARLLWEDDEPAAARSMAQAVLSRDANEENARFVLSAARQKNTVRTGEKKVGAEALAPSVSPLPRNGESALPSVQSPQPKPKPSVPLALSPDCRHPVHKVERWICQDKGLQRQQAALMARFARAQLHAAGEAALGDDLRSWVTTRRNTCTDKACLRAAYAERLSVLALWSWD